MNDAREQTSSSGIEWPPTLRAELDSAPAARRAWYLTVGPAYLAIFVWAPFFDPLWASEVPHASLGWLAGRAILASIFCFALFYYPAALWGFRTGRRLGVVAASTFGTVGSEWLTGVAMAAAEIVWFAVAIDYAIQATFLGLVIAGLVPPAVLGPWQIGPATVRGPVFLCTAAFWIFITGMSALLRLSGVIAALMKVYAPVALVLLTITAIWLLPGLGAYQVEEGTAGDQAARATIHTSALPLFTGFFSLVGLMSVEWGAASARRRDVAVGGLMGIVLAGSWTAVMSLIVVAGTVGRLRAAHPVEAALAAVPPPLTFRWGVLNGVGGYPAAVILILFGLASLAPACYSAWIFTRKLATRWPRVPRVDWVWIGCTLALVLIATTWPSRLATVDYVMGLVFAPAAGAMTGDFLRQRGGWSGVRPGVQWVGAVAWAAGVAIRPVLDAMAAHGRLPVPSLTASPVAGFVAAALAYWSLARAGLERPATPVETLPPGSDEVVAIGGQVTIRSAGPEPTVG